MRRQNSLRELVDDLVEKFLLKLHVKEMNESCWWKFFLDFVNFSLLKIFTFIQLLLSQLECLGLVDGFEVFESFKRFLNVMDN